MTDIWHKEHKTRGGSILATDHGKILQNMVKDICHLKTIDLGAGDQGAKEIFPNYIGVDLPEFDVYTSEFGFIKEYEVVLMNALIDVLQFPTYVLPSILRYC